MAMMMTASTTFTGVVRVTLDHLPFGLALGAPGEALEAGDASGAPEAAGEAAGAPEAAGEAAGAPDGAGEAIGEPAGIGGTVPGAGDGTEMAPFGVT